MKRLKTRSKPTMEFIGTKRRMKRADRRKASVKKARYQKENGSGKLLDDDAFFVSIALLRKAGKRIREIGQEKEYRE